MSLRPGTRPPAWRKTIDVPFHDGLWMDGIGGFEITESIVPWRRTGLNAWRMCHAASCEGLSSNSQLIPIKCADNSLNERRRVHHGFLRLPTAAMIPPGGRGGLIPITVIKNGIGPVCV